MHQVEIRAPLKACEVPDLRAAIGWDRRDRDYPELFRRCLTWASIRDEERQLAAFAHLAGTGLQHAYLKDVMVHPSHHRRGMGTALVRALLLEAKTMGVEIVTVSYAEHHRPFYEQCGFRYSAGGLWTSAGG